MDNAVRFRAVEKRFAGCTIGPVDLACATGAVTVLLGPSGCGKSTLLRLVNGLVRADGGAVEVLGERLPEDRASLEALRRRMGYVIQEGGLFPHLTATENVTLLARHVGWAEKERSERMAEVCDFVRLPASLRDRLPGELSGGERQRVALARAIFLRPSLLLLDEPLGALDPLVRAELQEDLPAMFRAVGTTVILVTHDLREAAILGDRVALLRAGKVVEQGTFDALEGSSDAYVRRFFAAQLPKRGS